jgi:hypothetical protein
MEEFNHRRKDGNGWVDGWQYLHLFSSAIQMAYVNSPVLNLKIT